MTEQRNITTNEMNINTAKSTSDNYRNQRPGISRISKFLLYKKIKHRFNYQ